MITLEELRDREATLTNDIAEEREYDNPDRDYLEDLIEEREEVREKIAEHETAIERAEQEAANERW